MDGMREGGGERGEEGEQHTSRATPTEGLQSALWGTERQRSDWTRLSLSDAENQSDSQLFGKLLITEDAEFLPTILHPMNAQAVSHELMLNTDIIDSRQS